MNSEQPEQTSGLGDIVGFASVQQHPPATRPNAPAGGNPARTNRPFRATVERAPVGIAHVSPQGQWLWVNRQLCDILGYTCADLPTRTFQDIMYAPDLEASSETGKRMLAGEVETERLETRCIRQDGTLVWTHLTLSLARDEAGAPDYFLAILEDIDERKHLEEETRAVQALTDVALSHLSLDELLWALLDRISDVMRVDNVTILLMSPDSASLMVRAARGVEAEVAAQTAVPVGQGFAGTIAATREPLIVDDLSSFPAVSPFMREALRSAVGVPLVANGEVLGVVHVGTQTAHRFTERDVRVLQVVADRIALAIDRVHLFEMVQSASEVAFARAGELEAIFGTVADALVVYDLEGRVARANAAFDALMARVMEPELHPETLAARTEHTPFRDEQGAVLPAERLPQARVLGGEVLTGADAEDFIVRALDGHDIHLSITGAPLRDVEGRIVGAVCTLRDVTERRRAEEERTQMLSIVSHELRTPLTSVKAYTQVVRRRLERAGNPEAEHLAKAEGDINLVTRLVDDLLDATRLETGKLDLGITRLELRGLVAEVAERQRQATGRQLLLREPAPPAAERLEVRGDRTRVAQILANLLTNALKYSAADRPVTIDIEATTTEARIAVTDEGSGIPPEHLPHLFERFYRAPGIRVLSGSGVGLGLGLYISKTLVERQAGRIGVESVPGQGSTFWFTIPLASPSAPHE